MKERIIVVPDSLDLAKSLAYHDKAVFNTRIFTPLELALESMKRSGKIMEQEFVSRSEELAYYVEAVKGITYFETERLSDLKKINSTVNSIRQLVISDEETNIKEKLAKGQFKTKNDALYEVYKRYIDKLTEEKKIDTIGVIRKALDNDFVLDSEVICINEYPLLALDDELVNKLSGGKYKKVGLIDLFEAEEKKIHIGSYKNCYGSSNEVAMIIDDIYRDHKADQCVVACADYNSYSQIFFDYGSRYDIPICYGGGLSLINSYPGKLLWQYYNWAVTGNYGWEPFFKLIYSPYFDFELLDSLIVAEDEKKFNRNEFYKRVSRLRLTDEKSVNEKIIDDFKKAISRDINDNDRFSKYVKGMEIVSREMSLPVEEFLMKYTKIRKNSEFLRKFDESSLNAICNEIAIIKRIGLKISNDVIDMILRKKTYRQSARPGHLYICSIDKAASALKDDLYICGLSSANYPGSPKENPLLLDCDLKDFENSSLTSEGMIKTKREDLFELVRLASSLNNNVYISYPGLNVSELKHNNASSLIFELYRMENGKDKELSDLNKEIVKVAYFEPELSISRKIGEAYNSSAIIENKKAESDNQTKSAFELGRYSPSALNTFFNCRKQYFFKNLLKIPDRDDYDPYKVIEASEQGTLVHALMEHLSKHPMDKKQFSELSGQVFDEYMKISSPLIKDKITNVKEEFVEMLETGWEMDEHLKRKVAFREEDKTAVHEESGVVIHGYPDRVELTDEGKAVIVDFKSERDLNAHIEDDIDSCLQVIMYAYIVEKAMGYEVDHCEYRMLRGNVNNGIISCRYDEDMKKQLSEKLMEFKRSMQEADFEIGPMSKDEEKQRCKYCKYGSICGKVVEEIDEE